MLSHITNSTAGLKKFEYVNNSLFRCTFIFPKRVQVVEPAILHEHVLSISGLTNGPELQTVQQNFLQSKRNFLSNDVDVTQTFEIAMTLNVNNAKENYVKKSFMRWRQLGSNTFTGQGTVKADYCGSIIIEKFDRTGTILWKRTMKNVMLTNVSGDTEFDVTAVEPVQLSLSFVADYYEEAEI